MRFCKMAFWIVSYFKSNPSAISRSEPPWLYFTCNGAITSSVSFVFFGLFFTCKEAKFLTFFIALYPTLYANITYSKTIYHLFLFANTIYNELTGLGPLRKLRRNTTDKFLIKAKAKNVECDTVCYCPYKPGPTFR